MKQTYKSIAVDKSNFHRFKYVMGRENVAGELSKLSLEELKAQVFHVKSLRRRGALRGLTVFDLRLISTEFQNRGISVIF